VQALHRSDDARVENAMNAPYGNYANRFDLYRSAHKGVRKALFDAVTRIGAADCRDKEAAVAAAELARGIVALSRKHIGSETRFIHAAVEAREPGLMRALDHAHDDHAQQLDWLEATARDLEVAPTAASRVVIGARLYESLSQFVAAELSHMALEEQTVMPELWRLFSDEELMGMQQQIIQALGPDGLAMFLRPMLPAMNQAERGKMMDGLRQGLPPEQWDRVWRLAGEVLDAFSLAALAAALDRAPLAA
jgi:Hemerythrin HHE cation binding domain